MRAQALVVDPQHNANVRVEALHPQRGVDVALIVAAYEDDSPRVARVRGREGFLGDGGREHDAVLAQDPADLRRVVVVAVRHDGDHGHVVLLGQLDHQPVRERVGAADDVVVRASRHDARW